MHSYSLFTYGLFNEDVSSRELHDSQGPEAWEYGH
jgi:hypothetical protein